jgi:hypothetical protein
VTLPDLPDADSQRQSTRSSKAPATTNLRQGSEIFLIA